MSEIAFVMPTGDLGHKVSVKGFEALMRLAGGGDRILRRVTTDDYEQFVGVLYEDFDELLGDLENRRKSFAESRAC